MNKTAVVSALVASLIATPAAAHANPGLDWQPCTNQPGLQCATLAVPLDYANPGGETISLAVSRLPSTNPGKRTGVLLVNPGGQGDSQLGLPLELAARGLPRSVLDRYDLIGFDPRGIGNSTRVTCDLPAEFLVPPAFARDDADVDRQAALAKRTADGCAASPTARLLPHITTRDVAMDLDRIRAALGERRISYLGFSFGAYLGAVYSTMFPQRTDRVVLDSNPGPGGLDYAWSRRFAEGFEQLFPDFARWLAANDAAYHQGSTPEAVRAKYFELAARFDEVPAGDLTGALFRWLTYSLVQSTASYGFLAQIWQAAEQGPVQRPPLPPGFDFSGLLALACNQGTWPTEVNTYRGAVNRDRERFPLFGAAAANVWACAFWPVTPDAPAVRITDRGPSNILMVQNIRDNGTAFSGALRTRAALGNRARMIAVDQGGHLAYLHGVNACANDLTSAYLAGGERPGDRVC